MSVPDVHAAVLEALATHEILRRLGFLPEQIYLGPRSPSSRLLVTVSREGRRAHIDAGFCELPIDETIRQWTRAALWWNDDATEQERCAVLFASRAYAGAVTILTGLHAHGFRLERGADA